MSELFQLVHTDATSRHATLLPLFPFTNSSRKSPAWLSATTSSTKQVPTVSVEQKCSLQVFHTAFSRGGDGINCVPHTEVPPGPRSYRVTCQPGQADRGLSYFQGNHQHFQPLPASEGVASAIISNASSPLVLIPQTRSIFRAITQMRTGIVSTTHTRVSATQISKVCVIRRGNRFSVLEHFSF